MNRAIVLTMLAACAALSLAACRDEPGAAVPTGTTGTPASAASGPAALATSFAPLVHLADTEKNPPMDTAEFLANSSLMWVHDDACRDKTVAEQPVARDLGQGVYHGRMTSRRVTGCRATGPTYNSAQQTRPYDNPDLGAEGFVLTPHDKSLYRQGSTDAPVYVQYVTEEGSQAGRKGYVYWFFYPYNDFPAAGFGDHEGDWERISVVTDADDRPQRVVYSQHSNRCSENWKDVVGPDGRPQVYVAAGAHGSYPKPGDYDNPEKAVPIADHTSEEGAQWQTWGSVRDVAAQEWWGYRGGWGKKGHDVSVPGVGLVPADFMTGPVGPNPSRTMQDEVFTDKPCPKPKSATTTTTPTPTSTTTGKTPHTTAGAIQRMEKFLHALGSGDIATLCDIAGPAAKQAEDEGFGPCESTMKVTHDMVSAEQQAALREATVDPAKVTADGGRVEIPASAVRAATPFTSSDLGDSILEYRGDDWYVVD
jgi:hypothetical protein